MNMASSSDFRLTWLWRHAFINVLPGITAAEQEYFRDRYLAMRDKAAVLVAQVAAAMPGLTVHDISHLDALWEMASLVSEGTMTFSPAEAFVFGASVLLHDSAMSLAAYPGGLNDLKQTIPWKDTVTALIGEAPHGPEVVADPPQDIIQRAVPEVLRQLHAKQAEVLAKQGWVSENGETVYLIDEPELRYFYGETIGQIAHSHWWPLPRVEQELSEDLGAFPSRTKSLIDRIKLACLLRIADALHIDQRRAPRFLRALTRPQCESALHWTFQEKLALPHIEHEAVVFTSGAPFEIFEADAWWMAYDMISDINRELQEVDLLMQNRGQGLSFGARRVKGAGSPESLARTIHTHGWRPVDAQLRVSDIPKVVETLGGSKLYGDDPTVALRELIQNSADAIQARVRYQGRSQCWGTIIVALSSRGDDVWLSVEDNGIGMSEQVLTGPLIDFGASFWRSTLATQEFPGLIAKGMNAIGRYGIGFFSVFMLGKVVRVISRRCDRGEDSARLLEFRDGTTSRPILSNSAQGQAPIDGGTRVEVLLKTDPHGRGGLLRGDPHRDNVMTLQQLVASVAPNVAVSIEVEEKGVVSTATTPGDWITLGDSAFLSRLDPLGNADTSKSSHSAAMRVINGDDGTPLGRAFIKPSDYFWRARGWVTVGGLRATQLANIQGLLIGETLTASRSSAVPAVPKDCLAKWATEQAGIITKSNSDELVKAMCAEVVLECGGSLEGLPIVCYGQGEWLNEEQFRLRLNGLNELAIQFDGEFSYDEERDEVHPREFRNNFKGSQDVFVVPKHDGEILRVGRQSWPKSITGRLVQKNSNLAAEVRRILENVWGSEVEENMEEREVGTVGTVSIARDVSVFVRASQ